MTQRPDGPADLLVRLRVAARNNIAREVCEHAIQEIERLRAEQPTQAELVNLRAVNRDWNQLCEFTARHDEVTPENPTLLAWCEAAVAEIERMRLQLRDNPWSDKIAPVQGYRAGIPWSMHLRAYDEYCRRYGRQDALIDLEGRNCRGGFSTGELDMFIPGWRNELDQFNAIKAENEKQIGELRAEVAYQTARAAYYEHDGECCGGCVECGRLYEAMQATEKARTP